MLPAAGTCCAGHTHAAKRGAAGTTACEGGGTRTEAPRGTTKLSRVDHHDKEGWRGGILEGAPSPGMPAWVARRGMGPSDLRPPQAAGPPPRCWRRGDLLCPRWCITYKSGKSTGRHGCFCRLWYDEVQPTVVGRAEPHNLRVIHPNQGRVVTIRENSALPGASPAAREPAASGRRLTPLRPRRASPTTLCWWARRPPRPGAGCATAA